MTTTQVTQLLQRAAEGDRQASETAWTLVYDELQRIATSFLRREAHPSSMQSRDLVQEAFLRIFGTGNAPTVNDRRHFYRIAAQHMRRTIVDGIRRENAKKRGGPPVSLEGRGDLMASTPSQQVIELNDALEELQRHDETAAAVVEMRYFAGYSIEETAEYLGVSKSEVTQIFNFAKAWLYQRLR